MLPKVTEALGKVCALAREVFSRKLNKICDIHCVVCFMPTGRILFGQTSYNEIFILYEVSFKASQTTSLFT